MRRFLNQEGDANAVICWGVAFDKEDNFSICLGSDPKPFEFAVPDEVDHFLFYWYAEPRGLAAVRGNVLTSVCIGSLV